MNIKIYPAALTGTIPAIASKSAAHRALICAALGDSPCAVRLPESCNDIEATISCLKSLGAKTEPNGNCVTVIPIKPNNSSVTLDCGESGSTLRFLLPVAAALGMNARFTGAGRLPQRPLSPLKEQLACHGITTAQNAVSGEIISLSGQLASGEYSLSGSVSSQFITGLLFALPMLDGDSRITLTSPLQSAGYVDMTIEMLEAFGVGVDLAQSSLFIKGGQKYVSPKELDVEGDWSNAAFWLVAGVLGGNIRVKGLSLSSAQGDRKIIDILRQMGADITFDGEILRAGKSRLRATDIDASDIPDLVPVLAVAASVAQGTTTIYNAGRLRMKESDRIKTTCEMIKSVGGEIAEKADSLVIRGRPQLDGGICDSFNDHRIAMSLAAASAACAGPVVIENAQAVNKSFPSFFEDFRVLGGNVQVQN